MPKHGLERRRLERTQRRLAIAGNGLYLVGSVLYLVEASVTAAWLFVAGSLAALLAGVLPQLIRLWIQPRESDGDPRARAPWAAAPVAHPVPNSWA